MPDAKGASGGPLAGLFATVHALQLRGDAPDWLLSVAGDCPDLSEDLPRVLAEAMVPGVDVVFAAYDGQIYPPNALWRFSALVRHMGGAWRRPTRVGGRASSLRRRRGVHAISKAGMRSIRSPG